MNRIALLLTASFCSTAIFAQTEVTSQEAKTLYKSTSKRRVTVHDPSVVYEPTTQRYYIFGSHKAGGWTTDMQNWSSAVPSWTPASNAEAFVTPAVTTVKKGGQEVSLPTFNAMNWSARGDASYNIDGNMWAPDVIWNEKMQKWCMYLSINGDSWHSSIILLTADNIQGPYRYQAPVIICGFKDSQHSYKDTDLELVIGTQTALPSRYNVGNNWGRRWPHTIDPSVFYDEEGNLWMAYGSWSGGVWVIQLDEETGLRDYDVVYPSTGGSSDGVTSDPYFGKKIAGGYYVSGEGPYIEHVGNYYYLFMSYGFLDQKGGYEMRVFRSEKPDGPFVDPGGRNAIFTSYSLNYGPQAAARGCKLLGPYSHWGYMSQGERSQGHNSIIAAGDGRTYLVYHTRFCNDAKKADEGHQVRVHQVFQNKEGWLVAAPFEYNGETLTDADIAATQAFTTDELAGTYSVLVHKFTNDHNNLEQVEPITICLTTDGKVSGDHTGTWAIDAGTSYVTMTLSGMKYSGVAIEEIMDQQNIHATAITALSTSGIGLWAYKLHPKYALAWQLNNQKVPVTNNQSYSLDVDLYGMHTGINDVMLNWTSSHPNIISDYGKYNPQGVDSDTKVDLTARLETPGYYWQQTYTVNALSEENAKPSGDGWLTGLLAHYGFDDAALANSFDAAQQAALLRKSTTAAPTLTDDEPLRIGNVVHTWQGVFGKESYVSMPNPLAGQQLTDGATIAFWVKRTDNNLWDALFALTDGDIRFFMTGNGYVGYNSGTGNWIDFNNPNSITTDFISTGSWNFVTLTVTNTAVTLYVNGIKKAFSKVNGSLNGTDFTNATKFDYQLILNLLATSQEFCLGMGSYWGSADAEFDDVLVYNRALTAIEVLDLRKMANRAYDFRSIASGIASTPAEELRSQQSVYDLQGRKLDSNMSGLQKGLYIIDGKKILVR